MKALDVGIIGAGTAGSAAALFLSRAGHHVDLYERVAEPSPVGAGVVLQPSGMAALERLGLKDEVVARCARLDGLRCVTSKGRMVLDLDYATLDPASFGMGMHRGVLSHALHGALHARGIPLHCGVEVRAIEASEPNLADRRFGRRTLRGVEGNVLGSYDLVLVCDGARSHLRGDVGPCCGAHLSVGRLVVRRARSGPNDWSRPVPGARRRAPHARSAADRAWTDGRYAAGQLVLQHPSGSIVQMAKRRRRGISRGMPAFDAKISAFRRTNSRR